MKSLLHGLEKLKNSKARRLVEARLQEFRALGKKPCREIYKELCFCTLTANFDAAKAIAVQEKVRNGFLSLPRRQLEAKLRKLGYRYPNRASYIVESRKLLPDLERAIAEKESEQALRDWIVKNVKGLGMKEASHFLRNIGFENLAIIDFHIVDLLEREKLIKRPKAMTRKRYLEIENVLSGIAREAGMSLAELDLYLWFMETGKILK